MSRFTRRRFLAGTAAIGGTAIVGSPASAGVDAAEAAQAAAKAAVQIGRGDRRYDDLVRGHNQRWVGRPDAVHLLRSPRQALHAVQDALDAHKRFAVRSGGHCFEDFVTTPDVKVVLDLSEMNAVYFDEQRRAFAVEAGATLTHVYETLFKNWGVTLPGGVCPTVGVGGHIAGGGFGYLSRRYGLTVDHLQAVEVVVVDRHRKARRVIASRNAGSQALRDLWWAHTGGGGGNFGVVTRYWFRTPGVAFHDPSKLLPRPPERILTAFVIWPWQAMSEQSVTRLVTNYSAWLAANSAANSPFVRVAADLGLAHRAGPNPIGMDVAVIDGSESHAEQLFGAFLAAVSDGVGIPPVIVEHRRQPLLHGVSWFGRFVTEASSTRSAAKSANMRSHFTEAQGQAIYRNLTRADGPPPQTRLGIASYGGRINAVAPTATASAQRNSVARLLYSASWLNRNEDATQIRYLREFYHDVYADTGGVPAPNAANDGCFINYPDRDVADPTFNTSGVSWQQLYYKGNYPRLKRAKGRWDPLNVSRHALSVELP